MSFYQNKMVLFEECVEGLVFFFKKYNLLEGDAIVS
jgi:hypothetical protein